MKTEMKELAQDKVRVIRVGEAALYEFLYESFIEKQSDFLDVDPLDVICSFQMDWERRQFLFCVHKAEDANGNLCPLPKAIDLETLLQVLPETTGSLFADGRYKEYTKEELTAYCQ